MEYRIAQRVASLSPSLTLSVSARAKQMRADGLDVVGFGAGEPDFDTPAPIKEACIQAIREGFTKYTPSSGIPELREAISEKFKHDNGIDYSPSQVIVTNGGKHACFNAIFSTAEPGDEVIIPAPYWLSYPEMVKLAGATPKVLPTDDKSGFKITPEQLTTSITPNSRLLILNSPGNPTGAVYSAEEIKAIGDVCVRHGILILSDEIYEKLIYDGVRHTSVAGLSQDHYDHTITVHGLAKAYSMTGWRIGYLAAPKPIAQAVDALQSHTTSNPVSFAQKGALAALRGSQAHLDEWKAEFDRRRLYAWQRLETMPAISCNKPEGAFYLFPNIRRSGLTSRPFCEQLLEEKQVAAVPGIAFGADDYIRISYATDMESLEKGLDRMEAFLKSLV